MKKLSICMLVAVAVISLALPLVSSAMTPIRESVTLSAGSGVWTNSRDYTVVKLINFESFGTQPAANTQTVSKVIQGTYTNSIGSLVSASGQGALATTQTIYMLKGDSLRFGGSTNAGTIYITGEAHP